MTPSGRVYLIRTSLRKSRTSAIPVTIIDNSTPIEGNYTPGSDFIAFITPTRIGSSTYTGLEIPVAIAMQLQGIEPPSIEVKKVIVSSGSPEYQTREFLRLSKAGDLIKLRNWLDHHPKFQLLSGDIDITYELRQKLKALP